MEDDSEVHHRHDFYDAMHFAKIGCYYPIRGGLRLVKQGSTISKRGSTCISCLRYFTGTLRITRWAGSDYLKQNGG